MISIIEVPSASVFPLVTASIGVLLAIPALILGLHLRKIVDYRIYSGKEVFTSVSKYNAFKEDVAQDGIQLDEAKVLSSSPPIIVQFTATVPANKTLKYGRSMLFTKADTSVSLLVLSVLSPGLFAFGVLILFFST